ncbi:type 2 lactosamine alpha-2,3-sialyltransferase isoform X2 [Meriones unguiculatus]|uniref:type 2 lactosamine alpha-2,3-sialyltransferase isoform X2 n=1 Tax=Meriones unguiculatus TaxID=10047 RepID=UPI001085D6B2|nr:type 2 lactosamine alpha-2,3-sialyltransferase isoform X2 [Meriones unguiculatus]
MRGYLVVIFLSSIFLYYLLHCILWRTNDYGVSPLDLIKTNKSNIQYCKKKPPFISLLRFPRFYPFLCAGDFEKSTYAYSSRNFALPYGTKISGGFFRAVLSLLPSCDVFDEFDKMNNGPVLGHEEEVGRRTTFRLFYPESVFSDPTQNDPNTTAVLIAFKPQDLRWLIEILTGSKIATDGFWKQPALNLIYNRSQIRILDPYITREAAYHFLHFPKVFPKDQKPKHPTTGIIAITMAFHICSEVHLAGFKYNFLSPNSPLHYYGNATMALMKQNAYHNVAAEQLFLTNIIKKKMVINLTQD